MGALAIGSGLLLAAHQMNEARHARKDAAGEADRQYFQNQKQRKELKNKIQNDKSATAQKLSRLRLMAGNSGGYSSESTASTPGTALGLGGRTGFKTTLGT